MLQNFIDLNSTPQLGGILNNLFKPKNN